MWLFNLSLVLILIASILLILIVLVQNPKGGGLASGFTGASQFGGVAQTNKFLEKSTWTLALAILVFSFIATVSVPTQQEQNSRLSEVVQNVDFSKPPTNPVNIQTPNTQQNTQQNNK